MELRGRYITVILLTLAATAWLVYSARKPIARSHLNVVLISIDTLRADRLGAYGYSGATSPFIDGVAARGAVFDEVIAPMPATDPSHAAMLTGLHPMRTGLLANAMPLRAEFETVAEAFRRAGYATAAATGVYHLSRRYGFDQGFERFSTVVAPALRRTAQAVNADVLRVVREQASAKSGRPLFLFVHYFDVHAPYRTHPEPTDYGRPNAPEALIGVLSEAYDAGVRAVDARVREVWEALERAGLSQNTVLAITADHGEQLGEHGFAGGHADLYAETIRVPLILAGPAIAPRRIAGTASVMDISPTLLDLAGLHFTRPTEGRTLVAELTGETPLPPSRGLLVLGYPIYARSVAWRDDAWYFVRNFERVYESLAFGPVPPSGEPTPAGMREAPWRDDGDRRIFSIPPIDFEPYRIVADIDGVAGCAAHAVVSIAPGIDLSEAFQVNGPTRVEYSLARLDSSFVTVTPRSCANGLTWKFRRIGEAPKGRFASKAAVVPSRLFNSLAPWRKRTDANELFDVARDPGMTRDLTGTDADRAAENLDAALESAFVAYGLDTQGGASTASDEKERLRALGYIK